MRKPVWGMLMAAGALLPGMASAQDDRPRSVNRQHSEQMQEANGIEPRSRGEGAERPAAWQRPDVAPDRPRPDRGGDQRPDRQFRPTPQAPAAVSPPQQRQPDWNRGNGDARRDGNRSDGRANWAPGTNGDGNGRPDWNNRGGDPRPAVTTRDDGRRDGRGNDGQRSYGRGSYGRGNDGRGTGYRPTPPSAGWQRDRADWIDQGRDRRGFDDRSQWNRGWRSDNRYDWNRYRTVNRGLYHLPRYYAPYGWGGGYRRFSVGVRLSEILFAQNYWIDDPWDYRLPPAYGPYRWVRYYNDALLVDVRYGEVVDTVYDIFW